MFTPVLKALFFIQQDQDAPNSLFLFLGLKKKKILSTCVKVEDVSDAQVKLTGKFSCCIQPKSCQ